MKKYKIEVTRYYYQPTGKIKGTMSDTYTREEAEKLIAEMDSMEYTLDHNECSRPEYEMVEVGGIRR